MSVEVEFRCQYCRQAVVVNSERKARWHKDGNGMGCPGSAVKAIVVMPPQPAAGRVAGDGEGVEGG